MMKITPIPHSLTTTMGLLAAFLPRSSGQFTPYSRHHYTVLLIAVLMLCRTDLLVSCSIHEVHEKVTGCKITERMFADGHGPWGIPEHSTVHVDATLRPLADHEVKNAITVRRLSDYFDFGVVLASYSSDAAIAVGFDDHTACSWNFSNSSNVDGELQGEFYLMERDQTLQVNMMFYPKEGGLQTALLVPCWKQKSAAFGYPVSADEFVAYPMVDPLLHMDAEFAFRNPYGFLPGLLYGLLPFNGVLSLMYGALDVYFLVLIYRHRQSVVGTHYFLLCVLLLATGESLAWFVTYKQLNDSGVPVCCPYPDSVLFSTFVKVLAGMVARIATTLVSLGYGIVRMQISWPEVFVVSGLGVCYFIAVGALEVSHLANQSDGDVRPPAVWEALVIMTNACFGGWIFLSLELTRKNLAAFGQTAKLQIYTSLNRILVAYLMTSFILMAIEGAIYSGAVRIPWTYTWVVWAATRLLFFGILLVAVYLWRPTKHGLLYAQMDQLPSREPVTPPSIARGFELNQRVASAADDEISPPSKHPLALASAKSTVCSSIAESL
ncbi:Lung seven transmembrane receptor [Phytophthora infestans]|uniref:Lung seven transmembrane receptor n=1 Tax=Phytophthora infestans TaxID=4787 RepID=A0A833T1V3_PHYIN|nr:Lung seven transmembrane receptor [Phytophthora infestans]